MQELGKYQRRALLKSHDPVHDRKLIASDTEAATYLPGTVLGLDPTTDKYIPWVKEVGAEGSKKSVTAPCVLAEDITVPASGDAWGLVYVHAAVLASELIWADGLSAADQKTALADLAAMGIYASEV